MADSGIDQQKLSSAIPGSAQNNASADEESQRVAAEAQMRRDLLATVLDPAARERRPSPCDYLLNVSSL